jgi:hypothetical protein
MILTGPKGVVIILPQFRGAVAQLGERMNGIHEAVGSIPSSSTSQKQKGFRYGKPFFVPFLLTYTRLADNSSLVSPRSREKIQNIPLSSFTKGGRSSPSSN